MSARTSNPPPRPPLSPAPIPSYQFPKWNGGHHSAVLPARHSPLACPDGGRVARHCLSNRNTPNLEFPASHTKQSLGQFLIATFRALPGMSVQSWFTLRNERLAPNSPEARKLENHLTPFRSATSKFLIDNFVHIFDGFSASKHQLVTDHCPLITAVGQSNRHTYEKLEVVLNLLPSTKVLFLIDTKMHFIQGENAQSQCSPPPKEGLTITS